MGLLGRLFGNKTKGIVDTLGRPSDVPRQSMLRERGILIKYLGAPFDADLAGAQRIIEQGELSQLHQGNHGLMIGDTGVYVMNEGKVNGNPAVYGVIGDPIGALFWRTELNCSYHDYTARAVVRAYGRPKWSGQLGETPGKVVMRRMDFPGTLDIDGNPVNPFIRVGPEYYFLESEMINSKPKFLYATPNGVCTQDLLVMPLNPEDGKPRDMRDYIFGVVGASNKPAPHITLEEDSCYSANEIETRLGEDGEYHWHVVDRSNGTEKIEAIPDKTCRYHWYVNRGNGTEELTVLRDYGYEVLAVDDGMVRRLQRKPVSRSASRRPIEPADTMCTAAKSLASL